MFRILDRYVVRTFIGSYALCFFFFVGLFLIVDFFNQIDDFLEARDTIREAGASVTASVASYYLYSIPFIFQQLAPFITVMAGLFTVTRLLKTNELYPMVHAGVSLYRVFSPLIFLSFLLTGAMLFAQEVLIPSLTWKRQEFARLCDGLDPSLIDEIETITDVHGDRVRIGSFDPEANRIHDLDVTRFRDRAELRAEIADFRGDRWVLDAGIPRDFEDPSAPLPIEREWITNITPADIRLATEDKSSLSFLQILETYRRHPERSELLTMMHRKLTFPLANVILLLLGCWAILRRRAQTAFFGISLCIVLCALFFATDFVAQALGARGTLHPILAAWLPVTLFGSLGITLFTGVRT